MPCKRTLTGRRERRMNRNSQYLLRHRDVNTSVEDDNLVVVLCDTFKCALNELPMTFANYSCGSMDIRCVKCNALHFKKEMTGNDKDKFTLCCHKGKVSLMPYSENSFFQTLCQGIASTDQAIKLRSKNYFENIRQFNSSFAMVSSEAKVDERVASGVYHFKIHDTFYHRAGPIAHMGTPRYAQLYFYDVDSANNYRMGEQSNAGCNRELMRDISYELNRINPDNEWRECLIEARQIYLPRQLRELFGFICALNVPANALDLWEEFKADLSEDYLRNYDNPDNAYNRALLHIQEICLSHNVTCAALGLPTPTFMSENENVEMFDPTEANAQFEELYGKSTEEQKRIIDEVIREVQFHDTGSNVFCLTAHAGCGKTFIETTIIHRLHALNVSVIATAFSGIASTLLIGGRTLHNAFKLPIPILDTSVANITANSAHGLHCRRSSQTK